MGHKGSKEINDAGHVKVTYGNIKDWPEDLIIHCYHILRVLWADNTSLKPGKRNGRFYWPKRRTRPTSITYDP